MKQSEYRCMSCADNITTKRIVIPGIMERCANCGKYPYTLYEKVGKSWRPTVVQAVHEY